MLVGWFFVYTSVYKLCTVVASYARSYPQGHSTLQAPPRQIYVKLTKGQKCAILSIVSLYFLICQPVD